MHWRRWELKANIHAIDDQVWDLCVFCVGKSLLSHPCWAHADLSLFPLQFVVSYLIPQPCIPNGFLLQGDTPIHLAIRGYDPKVDIIRILIELNADPTVSNNQVSRCLVTSVPKRYYYACRVKLRYKRVRISDSAMKWLPFWDLTWQSGSVTRFVWDLSPYSPYLTLWSRLRPPANHCLRDV